MPAARVPSSTPLDEQVLVAAFPDSVPEVHVASLQPERGLLLLREAAVVGNGEVSLGTERSVALAEAGSVDVGDGVVALLGRDGRLLVQMHLETPEDQRIWAEGLRTVVQVNNGLLGRSGNDRPSAQQTSPPQESAPEDTDDGDTQMLQARSRELQERIKTLEGVSQRRDKQLQKMIARQSGAMEMLAAVQEMCTQQKKVIGTQKIAIHELRSESGEADNTSNDEDQDASGDSENEEAQKADVQKAEAEIADKTAQMMQLLKQADEMQKALRELEALQQAGNDEASSGGTSPSPGTSPSQQKHAYPLSKDRAAISTPKAPASSPVSMGNVAEEFDDDYEDGESPDTQEALHRLKSLESEKARFEGLLSDSQKEHQDLLERLNGMRSMMAMLGMKEDVYEDEGDAEDSGE